MDNLAPAAPTGLAALEEGADILLTWTENEETDLGYYAVYRGTTADFTPATPIGYATVPAFTDDTLPVPDEYWYRVTACDCAGNESAPSMPAGVATAVPPTDETQATALSLVIEAASAGPVRLVYSIPGGAAAKQVRLTVYDTRGRLVRLLADGPRAGGVYTVSWDGTTTSSRAASGVYFCQLVWEGQSRTQRLVTVR